MEDKLVNTFYKNKKLKKWVRPFKQRSNAICSDSESSESAHSEHKESTLGKRLNEKKVRFK